MSIDFENMDVIDHIPYVVILIRVLEDWEKADGSPPSTSAEK